LQSFDFSKFDVVFNAAVIVHLKEKKSNKYLYYFINRDLSFETAKKAREDGVSHFIFLSSMSVYGIEKGEIDLNTKIKPRSFYGKSKYEGEKLIYSLENQLFKISVLRPPMIYGIKCKGNFTKLEKVALNSPIFPSIKNRRSMIYIDNFCQFVKVVIDNRLEGLFFPQNPEYVSTSMMVQLISSANGKKILFTKIFNFLINLTKVGVVNKVFGDLFYDQKMSNINYNYKLFNLDQSIFEMYINKDNTKPD
jgi:UDP-glucose 4-epimerase